MGVRKNESLDDALRRFKRSVSKAGTLQESRKRAEAIIMRTVFCAMLIWTIHAIRLMPISLQN